MYTYQSSGPGAPRTNDASYCGDCKQVILDALAAVPVRVRRDFEVVTDPALVAAVVAVRDAQDARAAEPSPPGEAFGAWFARRARQIRPGLIDMTTGAVLHVRVVYHEGVPYDVSEWSDKRKPPEVKRAVEVDVATGTRQPWRSADPDVLPLVRPTHVHLVERHVDYEPSELCAVFYDKALADARQAALASEALAKQAAPAASYRVDTVSVDDAAVVL